MLWILFSTGKLSPTVKKVLLKPDSKILISTISLWEISLKFRIGKLKLENKFPEEIPAVVGFMGFDIIGLDAATASSFYKIPQITNKDPFDFMLAWQAICENYILISKDKVFDVYQKSGLKRLW